MVRALNRGRNRHQIAEEVGLSYSAVCAIVKRYKKDGMKGLELGKRGRPTANSRKLTDEQEEKIRKLIQEKRPEQ